MAATTDAPPGAEREVNFLFEQSRSGFGPYVIVDPDLERLVGRAGRFGRYRVDPKRRGLNRDDFVADLDRLPPQLAGIVTEAEYLERMAELRSVLSTSSGAAVPFAIAIAFLITGLAVDVIWEWIGFFSVVLPPFSFFVSFSVLNSRFKAKVERIFQSWDNVKATFSSNVVKGNIALLTLRVTSPSLSSSAPNTATGLEEQNK